LVEFDIHKKRGKVFLLSLRQWSKEEKAMSVVLYVSGVVGLIGLVLLGERLTKRWWRNRKPAANRPVSQPSQSPKRLAPKEPAARGPAEPRKASQELSGDGPIEMTKVFPDGKGGWASTPNAGGKDVFVSAKVVADSGLGSLNVGQKLKAEWVWNPKAGKNSTGRFDVTKLSS
jgi:cold shock CspA family protein